MLLVKDMLSIVFTNFSDGPGFNVNPSNSTDVKIL
jgi:hypothetical protein